MLSTALERTASLWTSTSRMPVFPQLLENTRADVCVVGAGLTGITTAYLLARMGRSVVVLDDRGVGAGESGRTTAHLTTALDDRYSRLERLHGPEGARLAAQSHAAAIDRIEAIVQAEGIPCGFERLDGYLFLGPGQDREVLQEELEAARRAGVRGVELLARAPGAGFDTGLCLRFPRQAQLHPLRYLRGLSPVLTRGRSRIFGTHAARIEGGSPARVTTSSGFTVTAQAVVVATNTPVNDRLVIHTKQAAYRTYVIGARLPAGSLPHALYWDTARPYHSVRLQSLNPGGESPNPWSYDVLLVGGEDHKTGHAGDGTSPFDRLEAWSRERFPVLESVDYRWSAQVMKPVDGLGFIGPNPLDRANVYIATGDSGNLMTHGTIAGMLLCDFILKRPNPWARIYDPSRITLSAARAFTQENLNAAASYTGWVTGSDVESVEEIAPGCGAVLRLGLTKAAVYRDEAGMLHVCSAACPHLGCIVRWNTMEKTWDCPCHGSRFDPCGQVIHGPANANLPPAPQARKRLERLAGSWVSP